MSKKDLIKFDPAIPAKFREWFGPPAVLAADDHNTILCGLVHNVGPLDFIEGIFIDGLAHLVCERLALRRRRTNLIRRAHNEKFERQECELLQDAERRKEEVRKGDALSDVLDKWASANELAKREVERNKKLHEINDETNKKLAELHKAKDVLDEAACFDQWIDAVERVEQRLAQVEREIRNTLKALDEHRTGLGQRLRQATDEIIDAEFAEEPGPACEEAVDRAEPALNTEVSKASMQPTMGSRVAEPPASVSSQTNDGSPA